MGEFTPYVALLLAFGAVTTAVYVIGQHLSTHYRLQRRAVSAAGGSEPAQDVLAGMHNFVATYFDEKRFQVEGPAKTKLRRDLVRAGYFDANAINYYLFARMAAVIVLPVVTYLGVEFFLSEYSWWTKLVVVIIAMFLGVLGPDAYIKRRQRMLTEKYRIFFPDLLDLMIVCVDAGLSLEATFDRLSQELSRRSRELGMNLLLLGAETRAGRSSADALESFADRLGLDEARSFVAMLRQSIELGTDVGDALRVYSDEMRHRRLMRAEERANQLPVKMVMPLGLFIFPVILMVVMFPVMVRLMAVML